MALSGVGFGQTQEDVGDLASFGKEVKFFGYAVTGAVLIRRGCFAPYIPALGPNDRCFALNAPEWSSYDARDIGRIHFPAKTFENVIYLVARHEYTYKLLNSTAQNRVGQLQYNPYITIESAALDSPSLINPQTGQPFNGRVDIPLAGGKSFAKTIFPNYQEIDSLIYGSTSTGGFTRKYFRDHFDLPAAVVDDLFYQKMTIRLNMTGSTNYADTATINYGVRFLGN
jgi:hypothetical protein